ncbi:MAG: BadF/BadG/BcrA/BcrD ATPase family protein [Lachnospiraceae bacterium]|nr:BadF/BadG/BcrA/BcrD ATPase family protein [Lachnospiraceae bacterium]
MNYYIGIDGGGSKTEFLLCDQEGVRLAECRLGSASYKQIGIEGLERLLRQGFDLLLEQSGLSGSEQYNCCCGLPNWGESRQYDHLIAAFLAESFPEFHISLVNDCEVGWAGSLLLEEGINMVAGTGSIGYGKTKDGRTARAGGWSEFFSDEGSGRWLGMQCMELFTKEADGRCPKGALYFSIREHFELETDTDIIDIFEQDYNPKRDSIAGIQKLLLQAAQNGDMAAVAVYERAAKELADIVIALYERLFAPDACKVSYSGGIFQIQEYVQKPFASFLQSYPMEVVKPKASPTVGAVLLAKQIADGAKPKKGFMENLIRVDSKEREEV